MRVLSTHSPPSSLFSNSDKMIINMYQAGGKGNHKYSCSSLQITGRSSRSRLHCETHRLLRDTSCQVCSSSTSPFFFFLRLGPERLEDCVWTRSHGKWTDKSGRNENQTRGGWQRKAITSNEQHLSPAQSQSNHPSSSSRSLFTCHLSLPVTIPVIFLSLPLFFFFFSCYHPLCCCAIVDLPRGTVGCCRSARVTGVSLLC